MFVMPTFSFTALSEQDEVILKIYIFDRVSQSVEDQQYFRHALH